MSQQKENQEQPQNSTVEKKSRAPKQNNWFKRLFVFSVVVPSLLCTLYFVFLATDMYVSESLFTVKGEEGVQAADLETLLGTGPVMSPRDAYAVVDYIRSRDMLDILDEKFDLRKHYQNPDADFISRLNPAGLNEDFHKYWQRVVDVSFDAETGIVKLQVRAFTPEMARDVGSKIIQQSEDLVNSMHRKPHEDNLEQARKEVHRAETRLSSARMDVHIFQLQHRELSPETRAESRLQLVSQLELELAKAQAELSSKRSYLQESSQEIRQLRHRIEGLQNQIQFEQSRLTGAEMDQISSLVKEFKSLVLEEEFAEKQYLSAVSSLENARIKYESKTGYISPLQHPTKPQKATYPKRFMFSFLAFLAIFLGVGILFLVISAIKEHAGA